MVSDVHGVAVHNSLFKKGMPTDEDVKAALAWAQKIVDSDLK